MAVKYLGDDSTGHAFTVGETVTVDVTNEELDIASSFEGEEITYTATVLDSNTDKLPATFEADLMLNTTPLIEGQVFDAGHYSQSTGLLTLVWIVPAGAGNFTVSLHWEDQII